MPTTIKKRTRAILSGILLFVLCVFAVAAIGFSGYTLFKGFYKTKPVTSAAARGMFTVFVTRDIQEVLGLRFPERIQNGNGWEVTDIDFKNDNLADVEATDGQSAARFEFIFAIEEGTNVRVLRVTDVTSRELEDAYLTLIRYLGALRNGEYGAAAVYYGGSVSRLTPYGDRSTDIAALLKGYCEIVSPEGRCLSFTILDKIRDTATRAYKFNVNFYREAGSLYSLPDGTSMFRAIVEPRDDSYYVLTLPFD